MNSEKRHVSLVTTIATGEGNSLEMEYPDAFAAKSTLALSLCFCYRLQAEVRP